MSACRRSGCRPTRRPPRHAGVDEARRVVELVVVHREDDGGTPRLQRVVHHSRPAVVHHQRVAVQVGRVGDVAEAVEVPVVVVAAAGRVAVADVQLDLRQGARPRLLRRT